MTASIVVEVGSGVKEAVVEVRGIADADRDRDQHKVRPSDSVIQGGEGELVPGGKQIPHEDSGEAEVLRNNGIENVYTI